MTKKKECGCTTDVERRAHPPSNVVAQDWAYLVTYWGSNEFKKKSKTNKRNRQKQDLMHCAGSKSFACVSHEEASITGEEPTRLRLFELTYEPKKGADVDSKLGDILMHFRVTKARRADGISPEKELSDEDIWSQRMPPDRPGRVCGMGAGVTPSQFGSSRKAKEAAQARDEEVKSLREELTGTKQALQVMEGKFGTMWTFIQQLCSQQRIPPPQFAPDVDGGSGAGL